MNNDQNSLDPNELAYRLGAAKAVEKIASDRNVDEKVRHFLYNNLLDPIDHALLASSKQS